MGRAPMGTESDTVSGWFVLNTGFKVYGRCPHCHSPDLSYYKERRTGLKGISAASQGLTPVCLNCGLGLPVQRKRGEKMIPVRKEVSNKAV